MQLLTSKCFCCRLCFPSSHQVRDHLQGDLETTWAVKPGSGAGGCGVWLWCLWTLCLKVQGWLQGRDCPLFSSLSRAGLLGQLKRKMCCWCSSLHLILPSQFVPGSCIARAGFVGGNAITELQGGSGGFSPDSHVCASVSLSMKSC